MGFLVHQNAHGFTRGVPIVYTNGRWVFSSTRWDAVVESIQSADIFSATDHGTIEYPFGSVTTGQVIVNKDGSTPIGTIIAPNKMLLKRVSDSGSTTTTEKTTVTLESIGAQPYSSVLTTLADLTPGDGYLTGTTAGAMSWTFPTVQEEIQTLSGGQTIITLATFTTDNIAIYIEGARENEFTALNSTQIQLARSYVAGTKVVIFHNDTASNGVTTYGTAGGDLGGNFPNPIVKQVRSTNKTMQYNPDGTLSLITDSYGSKAFTYSSGLLISVIGTGIYQNKTFTYSGGVLTNITVS